MADDRPEDPGVMPAFEDNYGDTPPPEGFGEGFGDDPEPDKDGGLMESLDGPRLAAGGRDLALGAGSDADLDLGIIGSAPEDDHAKRDMELLRKVRTRCPGYSALSTVRARFVLFRPQETQLQPVLMSLHTGKWAGFAEVKDALSPMATGPVLVLVLMGDTFVGYGRVIRVDEEAQTVPIQWLKQARIPLSKVQSRTPWSLDRYLRLPSEVMALPPNVGRRVCIIIVAADIPDGEQMQSGLGGTLLDLGRGPGGSPPPGGYGDYDDKGKKGAQRKGRQASFQNGYVPNKIFVGGLPITCSESQFREYFEQYGKVLKVEFFFGRCFGYITYNTSQEVDAVLHRYNEHYINKKWIEVKRSVPRALMTREDEPDMGKGPPPDRWDGGKGKGSPLQRGPMGGGYGKGPGGPGGYPDRRPYNQPVGHQLGPMDQGGMHQPPPQQQPMGLMGMPGGMGMQGMAMPQSMNAPQGMGPGMGGSMGGGGMGGGGMGGGGMGGMPGNQAVMGVGGMGPWGGGAQWGAPPQQMGGGMQMGMQPAGGMAPPAMQQPVMQPAVMQAPAPQPLPGPAGRPPPMPPESVVPGLGADQPNLPGGVKMTDQGILVEVMRDFDPPAGFEEAQLLRVRSGHQVFVVSENHEGSGWCYGHLVDQTGTWSGFFPRACTPSLDIVTATHEFNREGLKEVSLVEGDRLFVEQRHGSGWYLGRHILPNGMVDMTQSKCGWFPASHCRDGTG